MTVNIKLLEPERFPELPFEADPSNCFVVVAEDSETHEIKGHWAVQLVVHAEPIWIDPATRDSGFVGLKMYAQLLAKFNELGIKNFYCFADREDIAGYLERLGLKLTPFITYLGEVPEIKDQKCPQQSLQPVLEPVVPSSVVS